jgi:FkbM family methyltransferase
MGRSPITSRGPIPHPGITRRLIDSKPGQALKPFLGDAIARAGFELVPSTRPSSVRLQGTLRALGVMCVLDVGANQGQFATMLRASGFEGPIHSFEPQSRAFATLQRRAQGDPRWTCANVALASRAGAGLLHISSNSTSSSLLEMGALHEEAAPESRVVASEEVALTTLDAAVLGCGLPTPYFLKIDVQGAELDVLGGAEAVLADTLLIQLEASLQPLYKGAPGATAILTWLDAHDYIPIGMTEGFTDPRTGELLQIDILAKRTGYPCVDVD